MSALILGFYILVFIVLLIYAPEAIFDSQSQQFVFILGIVGAWRYSWGFIHYIRSFYYRNVIFKKKRQAINQIIENAGEDYQPPEVFIVVTAYKIPCDTLITVMRSVFSEAANYPSKVTVVTSLVEMADQRLVKKIYTQFAQKQGVRLVVSRIAGSGKRDGLAVALKSIARSKPDKRSVTIVMDGDAVLTRYTLIRTLPLFDVDQRLYALTTDEDAYVAGGGRLFSHWHKLRFAQRHLLMGSMALSRRLLTLTGRMSAFRTSIATDPDFIDRIANDYIDNWRLGRVKLLTGEDKSSCFWLMKNECDMLYVPDVKVWTIEHPPSKSFLQASTALMLRWSGNMLRLGEKAIALGPNKLGFFVWWCVIDQRLSMWTPLIGPIIAVCLSLVVSPVFLYAYLIWVMTTRLVQTIMLLAARDEVSGYYPFLIYYNQVYGALVKTFILFRPHLQRWTRQNTSLHISSRWRKFEHAVSSAAVHVLALAALFVVTGYATGLLVIPRFALLP